MPRKFLVVCLNPVIQKTLVFDGLELDRVNRAKRLRTDASGKGVNVARVLSQLGAEVLHLTHAGGPDRDWFLSLCAADGLDVKWVDSGSEVRFCSTVIDAGAETATELVEEARPVRAGTEERLLGLFGELIEGADVLIISGTRAAGYSDSVVPEMARRASALGLMTVLDIKGRDLVSCLPFRPTVVKPNLDEFLATFPAPGGVDSAGGEGGARDTDVTDRGGSGGQALRAHVQQHAKAWKDRYGTDLVVTRGKAPIWFSENGLAAEEPAPQATSLNPTGSGDAFTAGLAYVLAAGGDLREAIREGARLGALNAERLKPGSIV